MSAKKNLRNNIDIVEELIRLDGYEMSVRRAGRRKGGGAPQFRVAIGQRGDWWSTGDGASFPVALERALRQFRDDFYEMHEIDEPDEFGDPIVTMLEAL